MNIWRGMETLIQRVQDRAQPVLPVADAGEIQNNAADTCDVSGELVSQLRDRIRSNVGVHEKCPRHRSGMPRVKVPRSLMNTAAISLYRSMVLDRPPTTASWNQTVDKKPSRSIKFYASEKYTKLKNAILSDELKEDIASGRALMLHSPLAAVAESLEEWGRATRQTLGSEGYSHFCVDTGASDVVARLQRELESRKASSESVISAFHTTFPSYTPGDFNRSIMSSLQEV